MKRLIVAIILMVVLIAGCFWGYSQLDTVTQEVADGVAVADQLLADTQPEEARSALQNAYELWRLRQAMLGAVVRHDELDDIENLFQRAMQSLEDEDTAEYRLQSRELRSMLLHVPEMELPTIQNIF